MSATKVQGQAFPRVEWQVIPYLHLLELILSHLVEMLSEEPEPRGDSSVCEAHDVFEEAR